MKAYGPFIFFVITAWACPLFAQQEPPPHMVEIDRVCGRLLGAGFREESDTLQTAFYIRSIIDKPSDRFAESVPPHIARNRLVQAWLFGAPRDRGREEVGRFEKAMRRQYRNPSPTLLMWLHNHGIRIVSNGDDFAVDLALSMNAYWVPALREKVAMTNDYIRGSMIMTRLCVATPSGSRDVAAALGVANADQARQIKQVGEKLNALAAYWLTKEDETVKHPVYLRLYDAAKLYQQGRFTDAIGACEKVMEKERREYSTLLYRCWVDSLWRSGSKEAARAAIDTGLKASASIAVLLLKAEYALHDGNIQEAKESLGFLAQYPENPAGQMLRARVAAAEGDVAEWLDAAIQTLFYSYGWEEDFFGQALAAGDLAIKRAKKR